jgi:hypothetical protein
MCDSTNCGHTQALMEMTYNELLRQTKTGETVRNSPRVSNAHKVQIQQVVLIPSTNEKTLTAKATTRTSKKSYETIIVFSGVSFFNEGGNGRQEIQVNDGSTYFIDPIRPYKSNVKVRCTCLDFYFRWSVWDQRDKALTGEPPEPYHRKTTTYPPVNPQKLSGVCKHIIALTDYLKRERIIR